MKQWIAAFIVCLLTCPSFAQHERYELGRRLRAFEAVWEEQKDLTIRKKALADLPKVTNQFFSLQLGEAGRTLDEAKRILQGRKSSENDAWVSSLYFSAPKLLIDAEQKEIEITLKHFYKPNVKQPDLVKLIGRVGNVKLTEPNNSVSKIPYSLKYSLTSLPRVDLLHNGPARNRGSGTRYREEVITTAVNAVYVSRVKDLSSRMANLKKAVYALPSPLQTLEHATLKDFYELLTDALDGGIPESEIRFGEVLTQAEYLANTDKPFFVPSEIEDWQSTRISFPTGVKRNTTPARVCIPPKDKLTKSTPIVIALHGAGGSENLFVEGYGNGRIVYECSKRNWILISPRAPGFTAVAPVLQMVDQLAERFPIDKSKIFLVGHSMGAAQAIELCQRDPGKFAGVAALGGGGRVRNTKAFTDLPTFIGVGTKDFALSGSRSLKKTLADGGAKQLTYREYPDFEHLVIVREALPDVFAMFDDVVKAKPAVRP